MRIPLAVNLESRDGSLDKDSRMVNCYAEVKSGVAYIATRPGLLQKLDLTASNGNGMFCWGGTFYAANGATLAQGPTVDAVADGSAWTYLSDPSTTIVSQRTPVCEHDGELWFMDTSGGGKKVYKTSDGVNITTVTLSPTGLPTLTQIYIISFDGFIYGFPTNSGVGDAVYKTTDGITWTLVTATAGFGDKANGMAVCVHNSKLWLAGGNNDNDVWYSSTGASWTQATASASWSNRASLGMCSYQGKLWITGGVGASEYNDVWYSTDGITWTQATAAAAFSTRYIGGMFTYNNRLFVVGGYSTSSGGIVKDVYSSFDGVTWTQKTSNLGGTGFYTSVPGLGSFIAISTTDLRQATINNPGGYTYTIDDLPTNYTNTSGAASTEYLVLKNANTAWVLTNGNPGVLTEITDGDYPSVTVDGIVYLDGYFFVMDVNGVIYNSDLEDPTSWNSLNFITAESAPDAGVAIAKHQNYVVALKSTTVELFYDAANPTASPLAPLSNTPLQIGCANGKSVVSLDGGLIFMSQTGSYGPSVHYFQAESLTPIEIASEDVKRVLAASALTTVRAFGMRMSGHTFYVLNLLSDGVSLVYDFTTKHWATWTYREESSPITLTSLSQSNGVATAVKTSHGFSDGDVVTHAGATPSGYNVTENITYIDANTYTFPVSSALSTPATGTITAIGTIETHFPFSAFQSCGGVDYIQHEDSGIIYEISDAHLDDDGQYIDVHVRTPILDIGTASPKTCGQLELIGDKVSANALVRWSDDDYTTYSKYRIIDLSINRSKTRRLGQFNRRAFEVRVTDSVSVRLSNIELEGI